MCIAARLEDNGEMDEEDVEDGIVLVRRKITPMWDGLVRL